MLTGHAGDRFKQSGPRPVTLPISLGQEEEEKPICSVRASFSIFHSSRIDQRIHALGPAPAEVRRIQPLPVRLLFFELPSVVDEL